MLEASQQMAPTTRFRRVADFVREVADEWVEDGVLVHGAALAFYTFFSLAPLLVLAIAVAGLAFGRSAAQGEIVAQIQDAVGAEAAHAVQNMLTQASQPASGITATVISLLTMFFGASGVFGQLQSSLNTIWRVKPKKLSAVRGAVQRRATSFGMVLAIGLLLLLSLVVSSVVAGVRERLQADAPTLAGLLPSMNLLVSFVTMTLLFALIYKVLPAIHLAWRDVWIGSGVTAVLFLLGQSVITLYLSHVITHSVYGAAGSLIFVLLWIYYSAQVVLIGAEFTEVYSRHFGSRLAEGPRQDKDKPKGDGAG
jgi:membrane protein